MRALGLALVLMLGAYSGCATLANAAGAPVRDIAVASAVQGLMERLQADLSGEVALCLTGFVRDGVAHVTGIDATHISAYSQTFVTFARCDPARHVGWFHTHPSGNCTFSVPDRQTHDKMRTHVAVVACKGGVAWRKLGEK